MLIIPGVEVWLDGVKSGPMKKNEVMGVVRVVFELVEDVFGEELDVERSGEEDQTQQI